MKTTKPQTWTVHHFVRDDSEPTELGLYEIEEVNEQLNEMAKDESCTMLQMLDVAEKNKLLISAAPALLAALKSFVDPWTIGGEWQSKLNYDTLCDAREVIAIATGKAVP